MSTRCYVGVELRKDNEILKAPNDFKEKVSDYKDIDTSDNKFASIYCHHDGYVTGVGKTLLELFPENNPETYNKVCELVAMGDTSSIDIDNNGNTLSDAYAVDEGYADNKPLLSRNPPTVDTFIEYVYLFTKDNTWKLQRSRFFTNPNGEFENLGKNDAFFPLTEQKELNQ